ncbi:THAP domain-containing protein 1-like [Sitophilus oryzae]|uniref:THAP domain-containing protein 1-like n=1 Tax=Sitophilus oryzae TaxID=7048 RepID=A0A6J2XNK1_SITOR|nr:THAP domain-containing protein 1-like [Sitophilus oryzae]XP_030753104.1 THAP domain-containing protein 1-like [Sitophilus oryzae]
MVGCAAYGCNSSSYRKEPGITFHRFPLKNEKLLSIWVRNMHLTDFKPTASDRLGSKHFEQKYFYRTDSNKTYLLGEAIPIKFEALPKYLQPKSTPKRATKRSRENIEVPSTSAEVKNCLQIFL